MDVINSHLNADHVDPNMSGLRLWDLFVSLAADGAMVGRTGCHVDEHVSRLVNLPGRNGHHDLFHLYDLCGARVSRSRAQAEQKSSFSSSSSSSDSSSSSGEDEADDPFCSLRRWQKLLKRLRRLFACGQGRVVLNRAFADMGYKRTAGIACPSATRKIVYAAGYLRQSLRHFGAWAS